MFKEVYRSTCSMHCFETLKSVIDTGNIPLFFELGKLFPFSFSQMITFQDLQFSKTQKLFHVGEIGKRFI